MSAAFRQERPASEAPAMNLREMCERYNIRFKKGLGQNLLLDDNINRIMVEAAALSEDDAVVEVGAGLGALTRRLAAQAGRLLAVEIDMSFLPCLEDQFGALEHVHIFRGDILNHPIEKLVDQHLPDAQHYKMLGNLPYYITTPILFAFLESPVFFERLVVMMQEEVAERLTARVGAENYGVLSVAGRLYADVDIVHRVPRTCFVPRPKVDSSIVRFRSKPHAPDAPAPRQYVMRVARAAFSQRRKTLRNSLAKSSAFGVAAEKVLEAMEAVGIDPGRRPQTLDANDFQVLAAAIRERS